MELGLAGRTALITGGTSGIGLAVARRLGEEGCNIAICGRKQAKLDAALAGLHLGKAKGLVADICEPDDVAALVRDVVEAFGRIDIVVSNAGTHLAGRIDEVATDDLIRHFHTKVVGPWELARRVAPHMRRHGGGRFIVIIGQTGKVPQANAIASTITNAAQHAFVKSLSDELAPSHILVNAVCPSRIKSPLTDGLSRPQSRAAGNAVGRRGPARPLGHGAGYRQCGRVPGVGPGRVHLWGQHRRRWRAPADDLLDHVLRQSLRRPSGARRKAQARNP
jgi:3-oxoacyl-[acyl-carrier protein] reductase